MTSFYTFSDKEVLCHSNPNCCRGFRNFLTVFFLPFSLLLSYTLISLLYLSDLCNRKNLIPSTNKIRVSKNLSHVFSFNEFHFNLIVIDCTRLLCFKYRPYESTSFLCSFLNCFTVQVLLSRCSREDPCSPSIPT